MKTMAPKYLVWSSSAASCMRSFCWCCSLKLLVTTRTKVLCKITTILVVKSAILAHWPLVAQTVKNPPTIQEIWVQFLGQEDSLQKGMAIYSSILAWRIPGTEETGGLRSMGLQRVGRD